MFRTLSIAAAALAFMAAPASAATFTGPGTVIPDVTTVTSDINVGSSFSVTNVTLTLNNLTHTFWNDLQIALIHNGVTVILVDDSGGGSDPNGNFTFDDAATTPSTSINTTGGNFSPLQALAGFNGLDASGIWTLQIADQVGADRGNLEGWTLNLGGDAGVPEPAAWTMMIAGFGLVGGAMRRRSTKVAYA